MTFRWHSNLAAGNMWMPEREPEVPPPPPEPGLLASAYDETVAFLRVAPRRDDGSLEAGASLIRGLRDNGLLLTAQGAGTLLALCDRTVPSKAEFVHCCCLGTAEPAAVRHPESGAGGRDVRCPRPCAAPAGQSPLRKLCSHAAPSPGARPGTELVLGGGANRVSQTQRSSPSAVRR